jgi:flagellar biosynthesis protein FlhF
MIVRSYTGRSVPEALEKVRNDLGDRALIIETRPVREPGLFGRRTGYEVVAAVDHEKPAGQRPIPAATANRLADWSASAPATRPSARSEPAPRPEIPSQAASLAAAAQSAQAAQAAAGGGQIADLESELLSIRRQLTRLAAGTGTPCGNLGEDLTSRLEDAELPAEVVAELDAAVGSAGERLPADRREAFASAVLARGLAGWTPMDWDAARILLVVGPTGVGKTTTIAKLASDLVLRLGRRVVLLTIDCYRVGAQDQLKAYADLLDIPCDVATTPAQLAELIRQHAGADNILIDTAGRSPGDAARVHELRGFARAAPGIQVCLATAANAGRAEFAAVVERFSTLPIEHAIVTKLDECAAPGRLYGCLRRHRLPVRWFTTGQEVPNDIAQAEPADLVRRVLDCGSAVAA